jgi:hypothetical protein
MSVSEIFPEGGIFFPSPASYLMALNSFELSLELAKALIEL